MTESAATLDCVARYFVAYRFTVDSTSRRRPGRPRLDLPCRRHDPELWFAEDPADLELAKALCTGCPIRLACLAVAVQNAEEAGVWGGHIFVRGQIVPRKRRRGRPRKNESPHPAREEQDMATTVAPTSRNRADLAAVRLYNAECALHAAHQSGVELWITAASEKLHEAVVDYLAAVGAGHSAPRERPLDAR